MLYRSIITTLLFIQLALPVATSAQSVDRATLLAQIQTLLGQIEQLQTQLDALRTEETLVFRVPRERYETIYYDGPIESVYQVRNARLSAPGNNSVRSIDQRLFTHVRAVYGRELVDRYIKEFQVYDNRRSEVSAFVERKTGTDEWILGINRYDFDLNRQGDRELLAELLVHELAHVLVVYEDDMLERFADLFWTDVDQAHANRVVELRREARFDASLAYYERHNDRFISDYATLSAEEDLAEMFVAYVADEAFPRSSQLRQKRDFFIDYPLFREAKHTLQTVLQ